MGILDFLVKKISDTIKGPRKFENVKESAPNEVGVYIMYHENKVKYVGRAIEDRQDQSTKGLRKRLQEHWRGALNCKQEIFQHRDEITVNIKVCANAEEAKKLEANLIRKYDTVNNGWNLKYED